MPQAFLLTPDRAAEAAEALAQAFMDESTTDFFFPPDEGLKIDKLRTLFGWAVEYRMIAGLPVLAVAEESGRIVGAATLLTPSTEGLSEVVDRTWTQVESALGEAASRRISRYDDLQEAHARTEPHHYIVAIGVTPDAQGNGYGGALLRAAIELAESDPRSKGIALDTSSGSNRGLYERFGFSVYATANLDDKFVHFMFRPNLVRKSE